MENKYTPELIATSQFKFSIPLYQRLFAWKKKEVTKLLLILKSILQRCLPMSHIISVCLLVLI